MFDMSMGEMLVIGVLVLVFFEPDQLPELMRQAGRLYGKVKGASDDLRRTFNAEVARVDADRRREELLRRREELARRRVQAAPDAVMRPSEVPPAAPAGPATTPPPSDTPPAADAAPGEPLP